MKLHTFSQYNKPNNSIHLCHRELAGRLSASVEISMERTFMVTTIHVNYSHEFEQYHAITFKSVHMNITTYPLYRWTIGNPHPVIQLNMFQFVVLSKKREKRIQS